jgi:hypothetical protein
MRYFPPVASTGAVTFASYVVRLGESGTPSLLACPDLACPDLVIAGQLNS